MNDPLGTLDVLATNAHFCDPAIDHTDFEPPPDGATVAGDAPALTGEERLARYRESRERSALVERTDAKPTLFHCRPLKASHVLGSLDQLSPSFRRMTIWCLAVHRVTLPDGSVRQPRKMARSLRGAPECAEDAWVDECSREWGAETIAEIADVVYDRARLPAKAKAGFLFRVGAGPAP